MLSSLSCGRWMEAENCEFRFFSVALTTARTIRLRRQSRLRFGTATKEGASRVSTATTAPARSKRYTLPVIGPTTVIPVKPKYSKLICGSGPPGTTRFEDSIACRSGTPSLYSIFFPHRHDILCLLVFYIVCNWNALTTRRKTFKQNRSSGKRRNKQEALQPTLT